MGNIVNFPNSENDKLDYDEIMGNNPYFQLTFINALNALGLEVCKDSVKKLQKDMELEETGIVSLEELLYAISVFDPSIRQDVLNNVEKYVDTNAVKKSNSDNNYFKAVLICLIFLVFFVWGIIDCWSLIWAKFGFKF